MRTPVKSVKVSVSAEHGFEDSPSRPLPAPGEVGEEESSPLSPFPATTSPFEQGKPVFPSSAIEFSSLDSPNPFASPVSSHVPHFGGGSPLASPFGTGASHLTLQSEKPFEDQSPKLGSSQFSSTDSDVSTSPFKSEGGSPFAAASGSTEGPFGLPEASLGYDNPFGAVSPAGGNSPFSSSGESPFGARSPFGSVGGSPFATNDSPNPFNTPTEDSVPMDKSVTLSSSVSLEPTALFASSDSFSFTGSNSSVDSTASTETDSSSPFGAISIPFLPNNSAPVDGGSPFGDVSLSDLCISTPPMAKESSPSLPEASSSHNAGAAPKRSRVNPFLEMTNHLQQVENSEYTPEQKVMLVAKLQGDDVRREASALEVTDTLGRIEVCMNAMRKTGKKFPQNAGRCLLTACLLENDNRSAELGLELLSLVTEKSYFSFMWARQCIACRAQNKVVVPKAEKTSVNRTYWAHLHQLHLDASFDIDNEESSEPSISDLRWDWEYGQEPIIIAFENPIYEEVACAMFETLSNSYLLYSKATIMNNTARSKAAQLTHCLAVAGCQSTLEKTLFRHFNGIVTALAAPNTLHHSSMWTQRFLGGVATCFEAACSFMKEQTDEGKKEYLLSAMCQCFLNVTHVMDEAHALPFLERLLQASPPELEEFIAEDHIITGNMRPFLTEPYEQSMCCLATILDQVTSMGFENAVSKIAEKYAAGLQKMPRVKLARILFSAGELGRYGCIVPIVSAVGPSILLHRAGRGHRVIWQLKSHNDWILESFEKMFNETPEEALRFYQMTGRSCLEELLCFARDSRSHGLNLHDWVLARIEGLRSSDNDEVADIEIANCFAFANGYRTDFRKRLRAYLRPETILLIPTRILKYLGDLPADTRKLVVEDELIPLVDESFFLKTDNDEKLTPLAFCARELPSCFSSVLAACPEALAHPLEAVGSALHVLIASQNDSVEILTEVFDLVEDRDFLELVDQYGNNILHVAALTSTSRKVLEMLRSMMPTSVASAKNKAGHTPLEVYHMVGYDRNGAKEDLSSIFLATSMAKKAL